EELAGVLNLKIGCSPHCFDTREDASATRQNIHVGSALNAPLKFIGTSPGKNSMGVGVDEARQYNPAGRIELWSALIGKLIRWTDPLNVTVPNANGTVVDDGQFFQGVAAARRRGTAKCQELCGMNNIEIPHPVQSRLSSDVGNT